MTHLAYVHDTKMTAIIKKKKWYKDDSFNYQTLAVFCSHVVSSWKLSKWSKKTHIHDAHSPYLTFKLPFVRYNQKEDTN